MIKAKIIKDSVAENGKRLTTFELDYPRFIHAEFMTHRMVSKNSASSRAIPVMTMIKSIWSNPAHPVHWGKNQSGMQSKEELTGFKLKATKFLWNFSGKVACCFAYILNKIGCHKQIVNRITEPWSHIKVVASATDWDNFFHLRNHKDAQPEIHELARLMWGCYENSIPKLLKIGEWHLPYIDDDKYIILDDHDGDNLHFDECMRNAMKKTPKELLLLDEAKKLSSSLCAQTSYRKSDESIKKAIIIYDKLVISEPVHASPFEHQGTPNKDPKSISGNFRGWTQLRQLIPNNVCFDYKEK